MVSRQNPLGLIYRPAAQCVAGYFRHQFDGLQKALQSMLAEYDTYIYGLTRGWVSLDLNTDALKTKETLVK